MLHSAVKVALSRRYWVILAILLIISVLLVLCLTLLDYETALAYLINSYGAEKKEGLFRSKYFSLAIFHGLRITLMLFLGTMSPLGYLLFSYRNYLSAHFRQHTSLWHTYYQCYIAKYFVYTHKEAFFLISTIIILILYKLYLFQLLRIRIDEAFTFIYIIKKGFLSCLFYYPGPNNHILWSIIIYFFYKIGFNSELSLKLPILITDIICIFLIISYLLKKVKKNYIVLFIILYFSSSLSFYYLTQSRAYIIIQYIFIFQLILSNKIIKNKLRINLFLFLFINYIGFYFIPIYLIYYISLIIYLLINNIKIIFNYKLIKYSIINLIFIFIYIYLPIIIFNGFNHFLFNRHIISSIDYNKINYIKDIFLIEFIKTDNLYLLILLILIKLFLIFKINYLNNIISKLFISIYIVLFIFIFLFNINLPIRTIIYIEIANSILYTVTIIKLLEKYINTNQFKNLLFLIILLAIIYVRIYNSILEYNESKDIYSFVHKTTFKVAKLKPSSILILDDTYQIIYQFLLVDSPEFYQLDVIPSKEDWQYDVVILPHSTSKHYLQRLKDKNYTFWFSDVYVSVYRQK